MSIMWLATGLSILGNLFINRKNYKGFYIWIVANCMWIAEGIINDRGFQSTLFFVYLVLCIDGIRNWRSNNDLHTDEPGKHTKISG